jgi:hypothetical protein
LHQARQPLILVVRRQMQEIVSKLKSIPLISVSEAPNAAIIRIVKNDSFSFEITIPGSVLEWFVAIHENGKEIWTDWADYVPINNEPYSELKEWMQADIINFVQTAVKYQLRKVASKHLFGTKDAFEWFIDGNWEPITMSGV